MDACYEVYSEVSSDQLTPLIIAAHHEVLLDLTIAARHERYRA